jgi:hypothetical protein
MIRYKQVKREFFKIARWVHVYVSTALFSLLVFFAITGITLNHNWYDTHGGSQSLQTHSVTPAQITSWGMGDDWQPKVDTITDYLTEQFQLGVPASIDIDPELREIYVEYQVPAGFASAIISAELLELSLELEQGSLLALLNDLHKGRHSGATWFWLIDISAGLMVLFAITGLVILFHGRKYRVGGSWATMLGLATPVVLFLYFVPRVSI